MKQAAARLKRKLFNEVLPVALVLTAAAALH